MSILKFNDFINESITGNSLIKDITDFEENHTEAWDLCREIFDDDITYDTGDKMEDAIDKLHEEGKLTDDEYDFIYDNWFEIVGD